MEPALTFRRRLAGSALGWDCRRKKVVCKAAANLTVLASRVQGEDKLAFFSLLQRISVNRLASGFQDRRARGTLGEHPFVRPTTALAPARESPVDPPNVSSRAGFRMPAMAGPSAGTGRRPESAE